MQIARCSFENFPRTRTRVVTARCDNLAFLANITPDLEKIGNLHSLRLVEGDVLFRGLDCRVIDHLEDVFVRGTYLTSSFLVDFCHFGVPSLLQHGDGVGCHVNVDGVIGCILKCIPRKSNSSLTQSMEPNSLAKISSMLDMCTEELDEMKMSSTWKHRCVVP